MTTYQLVIGNKNWSTWSLRPWLLMKMAGIEFEEVFIQLRQDDTRAQCRAHSPSFKVPVLKAGELKVWDSLAICEFLADCYPEKMLWPQEARVRAVARAVSAEMHSGFQSLRQQMPMECKAIHDPIVMDEALQHDVQRIMEIWQDCRHCYGQGGPFLFGDFSIADAMFAPVASRFVTFQVPLAEPCLSYVKTIMALPAMQEWIAAA
ncbi:MAG: glutathione S-transferase [Kordiimonas sp.]|nr:glutathione S-transferase [Kordiimonas sp.]|tara:strand:- start:849 stop:1466 length:618 start_codon:yes stop_codon:yes gene_type:complete